MQSKKNIIRIPQFAINGELGYPYYIFALFHMALKKWKRQLDIFICVKIVKTRFLVQFRSPLLLYMDGN